MSLNQRLYTKTMLDKYHLEVLCTQTVGRGTILQRCSEADILYTEIIAPSFEELSSTGVTNLYHKYKQSVVRAQERHKVKIVCNPIHVSLEDSTSVYCGPNIDDIIVHRKSLKYLINVIRLFSLLNEYLGTAPPKIIVHAGRIGRSPEEYRTLLQPVISSLLLHGCTILVENAPILTKICFGSEPRLATVSDGIPAAIAWVDIINSAASTSIASLCLDIAHMYSDYKLHRYILGSTLDLHTPLTTVRDLLDSNLVSHVHFALSQNFGLEVAEHGCVPFTENGDYHYWTTTSPDFQTVVHRILCASDVPITLEVNELSYPSFVNRELARKGLLKHYERLQALN